MGLFGLLLSSRKDREYERSEVAKRSKTVENEMMVLYG
jgi:hypothetical protein